MAKFENLPPNDDSAAWKVKLLDYYSQNAPTKMKMVNDSMMAKYVGKYDGLYNNLVKKYGPLGKPLAQAPAAPAARAAPGSGGNKTVGDFHDSFVQLIAKATPVLPARAITNVVESKAAESANGLETSTFTVCARVRPLLPFEVGKGGEYFTAVVAGERIEPATGPTSTPYTEQMLLCNPKVSMMGAAKIEKETYDFDYVFGAESENIDVYELACKPLVERCLNGQVGVIFAYGQTGSGKTHTMNGLMDELIDSNLFSDNTEVAFQYLEMLGSNIKDCLEVAAEGAQGVAIGEMLDGRIMTRNLSTHECSTPAKLRSLVEKAKRLVEATGDKRPAQTRDEKGTTSGEKGATSGSKRAIRDQTRCSLVHTDL